MQRSAPHGWCVGVSLHAKSFRTPPRSVWVARSGSSGTCNRYELPRCATQQFEDPTLLSNKLCVPSPCHLRVDSISYVCRPTAPFSMLPTSDGSAPCATGIMTTCSVTGTVIQSGLLFPQTTVVNGDSVHSQYTVPARHGTLLVAHIRATPLTTSSTAPTISERWPPLKKCPTARRWPVHLVGGCITRYI